MLKLLTIGVYGFTSEAFFQALVDAHADLLCDVRLHRGMRGPRYTFANSLRLQQGLAELGICYVHLKELAPARTLRDLQRRVDSATGIAKRRRVALSRTFIETYKQYYLSTFRACDFIERLGPDVHIPALFCVEREPGACHRSLVAASLAQDLGLEVEHIVPMTRA